MASHDYDEKIYKLFEEGKRLGAPGIPSLNFPNAIVRHTTTVTDSDKPPFSGPVHHSKIDIAALEKEFDKQAKEANRLQQELNTARDNIQKTGQVISDNLRNSVAGKTQTSIPVPTFSEPVQFHANTNNNNLSSHPQSSEFSVLTNTKIHLENALEDSQAQVEYLTSKLDSMKRSMDEQKDRFRLAVEELQTKLHETVAGRKKLIELRQQDLQKQEETIHRLQATLKELAASNQMQEQALLDAHERMEILENRNQSNERAMTQIRSILSSNTNKNAARSKSASFLSSEHISELVPEILVDNLERFVTNSTEEADSLRSKLLQLEAELNAANQAHAADRILASSDAADVVHNLKAEHQQEIDFERSKCKEAEDSLNLLTNQLKELQVDHTAQSRLVSQSRDQISELTRQLDDLRRVHCSEKGDLQSKMVCLEYDVKLVNDKNERLNEDNQNYKESMTELNHRIHEVSAQLNTEREMRGNLAIKESDLSKEVHDMRLQLDEKNTEISRLREITAQLRGDMNTKVAKEINEAENAQRVKADERISALNHENVGLREDLSRVKASLEAAERQLSDVISERSEAMQMMKDKDKQVDRLSSQLSLSDRRLIEASEARKTCEERIKKMQNEITELSRDSKQSHSDTERLKATVDEKERVVLQLRHQLENKSEQLKNSNKQSEDASREGHFLKSRNQDQQEIIQELRDELKNKEKGLHEYEKRMNDLVAEKEKIVNDVHGIEKQISNLVEAKREVDDELKEARTQLSRLIEERDELTKELKSSHQIYRNDVEKLGRELKQKKMDLQLYQNAVQNVKEIDGKAVIMASNMQKEVTDKRGIIDALQTELSNVYEKLDTEHRDNKLYKKENSKLQQRIEDIKDKNKKAEQELRDRTKSEKGFKLAVERLQIALEKAAERNAAAQSVINKQEAELSKAHIRRNLDMMDKRIPPLPLGVIDERASGASNTFGRPPVAGTNNTVLQNMLARILATMATSQSRADDVTPSIPVHLVPASGRQSEVPNNLTTEDIYKVLTEVRKQLAQNSAQQKVSSRDVRERSRRHKTKRTPLPNESSELPVVFVHSDVTSLCSDTTQQSELDDVTLKRSLSHDFLTSSPYKAGGQTGMLRAPSPVSLLLAGGDCLHASPSDILDSKLNQFSPIKNQKKRRNGKGDSSVKHGVEKASDKFVKDAISDNAEELCRQLQSRLEGLSKIGGKLERQNKIEAKLMKKQDEKLKQIRESGQLWR